MNRRKDYDKADWSLTDAELARRYKVTKPAIVQARKARGIPPAVPHGGARPGAGKRKARIQ